MSELKGHIDTPMASLNLPHFAITCELDPLLRVIMDHHCVHDNCRLVKEYFIWQHRLSVDEVMWANTFNSTTFFPECISEI